MVIHKKTKIGLQIPLALVVVTGLLVGGYVLVHIHNVRSEQTKSNQVANSKSETGSTGTTSAPSQNDSQTSSTNSGKALQGDSPQASSAAPTQPYGNFVNNHHPGQDGSSTVMRSSCNTSPGATCDITLTSASGVVKDLGSKSSDANGAVIWSWDIAGSNMAPGDWIITATATLNGKTATATDAIKLEVQ